MRARVATLTAIAVAAMFAATPAHLHGQQPATAQEHEHHHPEATATPGQKAPATDATSGAHDMMGMMDRMKAADAKLDGLLKKMNAATGQAKVDATAELVTALVEDRRAMNDAMMAHMKSMMGGGMMGGGMNGGMKGQPPQK